MKGPRGRRRAWPFAVALVVGASIGVGVLALVTSEEGHPSAKVYWGAWIGDQLTGEEAPWDMGAVDAFEEQADKEPSLVEFGQPFATCEDGRCSPEEFPTGALEAIRERGAIPFLSWASEAIPATTAAQPSYQLADLIEGAYDAQIREFARAARAWGHPFFLRFDWEMNGDWFAWSAGANGNGPGEYVPAWRHVHDIFDEVGATDVAWVWCPYADPDRKLAPLSALYPGDGYVDWTCLDVYNWASTRRPPQPWRSFAELAGPSYREISGRVAPSKPMLIGETASTEHGGSKARWITGLFDALPTRFPRIHGLIWFDKDEDSDWPIETSAAAEAAFARGVGNERFAAGSFDSLEAGPSIQPIAP